SAERRNVPIARDVRRLNSVLTCRFDGTNGCLASTRAPFGAPLPSLGGEGKSKGRRSRRRKTNGRRERWLCACEWERAMTTAKLEGRNNSSTFSQNEANGQNAMIAMRQEVNATRGRRTSERGSEFGFAPAHDT